MNSILPKEGVYELVPLEEGFSNQTFCIRWCNQPQLVLRLTQESDDLFGVNRELESHIWRQAAQQGLTANIVWQQQSCVVSQFLAGYTFSWAVAHQDATLKPVCEVVQRLHQQPSVSQEYCVYALLERWLQALSENHCDSDMLTPIEQVQRFYRMLPKAPRPETLVLCHNDLNPKNVILKANRAWLIDWECAAMNDPLFDLGVLAHAHHLNYEQLQQAYSIIIGGALDEEHRYHIECYRQAYVLRELVWLLLRQVMGGAHELDGVQWYHALLNDPVFNPYFKTE